MYVLEYTDYKPYGDFNNPKDVGDKSELNEIPTIWIDKSKKVNPHQDDSVYITRNPNMETNKKTIVYWRKSVVRSFWTFTPMKKERSENKL